MSNTAKLIKKLRLKKGANYILFVPRECMPDMDDLIQLSEAIYNEGFYKVLLVRTETNKGIKVIEAEDIKASQRRFQEWLDSLEDPTNTDEKKTVQKKE